MPPKALQMPTLLKGDRIKVHFTLLETKEKRVWEGEVQQVHPCLCTFPSEMPGHLDGIPIPSPAANIKTTKVIVIKPNKAQKDTYPVPLPVASAVLPDQQVLVRLPISGEYTVIPIDDAKVIKDGFAKWVSEKGAPEEITMTLHGWAQVTVNFKTMHAVQYSKQHIKIQ